ncbi:Fibrinogen-like protein 1 [Merluccius polli]|uniref:Fibrinogen-like protein 1 n=1 Tax=Merluccius polli TaxID=89951 RepID=A0AA47M2Q0_MERPO|nr:Fibrinogen-like protein 1 [Merluccius polli]
MKRRLERKMCWLDTSGGVESLLLAMQKRPWLLGVYVFAIGLPVILFISFMWPDVRFGPPDQDYYYKKSDDVQPDDPEVSEYKQTLETKGLGLMRQRMAGQTFLIMGVMLIAAAAPALSTSDSCDEEFAQLMERERFLKSKVQKQKILLHRLQQLSQHQTQHHTQHQAQPPGDQAAGNTPYRDCADVFSSGSNSSGLYHIQARGSPVALGAHCDMSDGGGWTIIQRRADGSVLFNRSWTEYKNGFGDMQSGAGEFWFGNENLHYLTEQGIYNSLFKSKTGNYSLRIILGDLEGSQRYAQYDNFRVGPEKSDYQLSFGAYSGTAGDALSGSYEVGVSMWANHQGMRFSTYDRDNDNYTGNCAQEDKGGWWYNRCHSANLNGLYYPRGYYSAVTDDGVVWFTWKGWWYSLKTTVMKLRPANFKVDPL